MLKASSPNGSIGDPRLKHAGMTWVLLVVLSLSFSVLHAAEENKNPTAESIEKRQKVELMGFFLKDPKDAAFPKTNLAIQFYNQAVGHFEKSEYDLARQALKDSIAQEENNPLAYALLGDIDYLEQQLKDAKAHYELAYALGPTEDLKKKIEKLSEEIKVEKKLATYREQHFLIKYHDEEQRFEGFELRELLRQTYQTLSKDFAYYFNYQVVVLLYDEEEFRNIVQQPHWVGGVYDGKVRMPAYKKGFGNQELAALTAHEVTHAFVAAMSGKRAPAWINEGLAEYEENKIKKNDLIVFRSAIKTNTLLPLDQLLAQNATSSLPDALRVGLFYEESFHLVSYLVERYGMFDIKKMLAEFEKGKNSDEAVQEVLKISTARLEKEWKATFSK